MVIENKQLNKYELFINLLAEHLKIRETDIGELLSVTCPGCPPEIRGDVISILDGMLPMMENNEGESPIYLRGGLMREFLFHTQKITEFSQEIGKKIYEKIPPEDHFAKKVVENTYGPKDLDAIVNFRDVIIEDETVHRPSDEQVFSGLIALLRQIDFLPQRVTEPDVKCFIRGKYKVKLNTILIGINHKRSMYQLEFSNTEDNKRVFQFNFTDRPRSKAEWEEDIRFFEDSLHPDNLSTGKVKKSKKSLVVQTLAYGENNDSPINYYHEHYFLSPKTQEGTSFVKNIIGKIREINMNLANAGPMMLNVGLKSLNEALSTIKIAFKEVDDRSGNNRLTRFEIIEELGREKEFIQRKIIPIISEYFFLLVDCPFLGIPAGYYSGVFDTVPLGEVINSEDKLNEVLEYLETAIEGVNTNTVLGLVSQYKTKCILGSLDPLVIVDALKNLSFSEEETQSLRDKGNYPPDLPRSVTGLLKLLTPLGVELE